MCNKHSRNLKLDSPDLIWDRSHTAGAALSPSLPSAMDAHINDEKKASELACSARKMMVIVRWWYDAFFRVFFRDRRLCRVVSSLHDSANTLMCLIEHRKHFCWNSHDKLLYGWLNYTKKNTAFFPLFSRSPIPSFVLNNPFLSSPFIACLLLVE